MSSEDAFVPRGGSRLWPFALKAAAPPEVPRWKPTLLLCEGVIRALFRKPAVKPGALDFWNNAPRDWLGTFMRSEGAGAEHPSRSFVSGQVREQESVLDAGCGTGESYAVLAGTGRASGYVGIDSAAPVIELARSFYPAANFRVGEITNLVSIFGAQSFDVVVMRHVLEHQPDFQDPLHQAIAVSRRLAIFVFYLTPRALPFGVRSVDPRRDVPYHVNIYSRSAIERVLSRSGLHWAWHHALGVSRSGWLIGETNSVLLVSRQPLTVGST